MSMYTEIHDLCQLLLRCLNKNHNCEPLCGARGRIGGSPKSLGIMNICMTYIWYQILVLVHPVDGSWAVDILHRINYNFDLLVSLDVSKGNTRSHWDSSSKDHDYHLQWVKTNHAQICKCNEKHCAEVTEGKLGGLSNPHPLSRQLAEWHWPMTPTSLHYHILQAVKSMSETRRVGAEGEWSGPEEEE